MSDYLQWTEWENQRLEELRAEVAKPIKNVRAHVAREREAARHATGPRRVPPWGKQAAIEQEEEREVMAAYEAAPDHVRAWLDRLAAARLMGRTRPELFRHRVLLDVLLQWKAGALDAPEDGDE